jgi:Zn-dependent peptidase ImmA (M78 family)/transcriptional regulator with XRE-family HTH domain
MTTGTPGFVGARLTEAREALGLTKVALAELIDVSSMAISQYENGPQSPRADVLDKIIDKLGYPRAFFLRGVGPDDNEPIFWRSNASATKIARHRALQRLRWAKEATDYLLQFFDLPRVEILDFKVSDSTFRDMSTRQIEKFAQECRDSWNFGLGPVPDILLELENSGAITARINMGAETLEAFSQWSGRLNVPFVVLGEDHGSAVRSRFDAAHELGHLVLHRHIDQRRVNSKEDWKILEQQAHRFAASFLFPARAFNEELWAATLDGFLALKERWKVSIAMMIMRARHLGIVDAADVQRLYINYNRRGWKNEEPLDAVIKHESPKLMRRSFDALIQEGVKTKQQILDDLGLPARELEKLSAAHRGYFSGEQNEIKAFPMLKDSAKPQRAHESSPVIQLFGRKDKKD